MRWCASLCTRDARTACGVLTAANTSCRTQSIKPTSSARGTEIFSMASCESWSSHSKATRSQFHGKPINLKLFFFFSKTKFLILFHFIVFFFKLKNFTIERKKNYQQQQQEATESNETNNQDFDLNSFVKTFLKKHKKFEYFDTIRKKLDQMCANSIDDLMNMSPHVWDSNQLNTILGPILTPLLQKEIELKRASRSTRRISEKNKKKNIKTLGEIKGDVYKLIRFLFYETKFENSHGRASIDELSFLSLDALHTGFEEQRNDEKFDGGTVLNEIKEYLKSSFTNAKLPSLVKTSHGMILWGPPGTGRFQFLCFFVFLFESQLKLEKIKIWIYFCSGKTCLCNIICQKAGIELVVEPLSSAELNRSKVGETEQILVDLFRRAESMPHLLCCIVS